MRKGGTLMLGGRFSGSEAADLAGVAYHQLDYRARREWVVASCGARGVVRRRVYTRADVVRLAALGHLGRSRVDVAACAVATRRLPVPNSDGFVIVWAIDEKAVRAVAANKQGVVSEYDQLTAPGANGALLRREVLHTSHPVAWRRSAEADRTEVARRPAEPPSGETGLTAPRVAS